MKRLTSLIAASLVLAFGLTAQAQIPYYFDANDDAPESGVAVLDGQAFTWNTTVIAWNTINANGTQAAPGLNVAWVNGNDAVFSAGTDASVPGPMLNDPKGVVYGASIAAGIQSRDSIIQEGVFQVNTGILDATREILVKPGAALRSAASSQFPSGGGRITLQGTTITNAGEFQDRNVGSAGSMFTSGAATAVGKEIHIDGFGRISYDDGDNVPDNKVGIISRQWITGEGGTPTNGGAGTLVKSGPDQVGFASFADPNTGVWNYTLNSFAKLRVEQGSFRLRLVAGGIDERMFGAVPLNELADAITLDGGGIGTNTTVTLDAKRGITINNSAGNNLGVLSGDASLGGGYFDHNATASLVIPGPISGSGSLYIGDPTSSGAQSVAFTLSHANNVNTFSGNLIGVRSALQLNSSLKVNGLKDVSGFAQNPANNATITIASGNTLTVGVSGGGGTWSAAIGGAGGFTKMGGGTETLVGAKTYTGNTEVQGGTLSISSAYLADAADVKLKTGSFLDLNTSGATDDIHSLFIDNVLMSAGIWGSTTSGAAHPTPLITGSGFLNVLVGAVAGLPGDFNSDGKVDAGDYVTWRKNDGTNNALANDGGLGTPIGLGHYNLWRTNFGNPPGAGTSNGLSNAPVPEPASLGLLVVGLAAFGWGRRNR